MYSYWMARTSITSWSKTAGAGGIGSVRRGGRVLEMLEKEARESQRFYTRPNFSLGYVSV